MVAWAVFAVLVGLVGNGLVGCTGLVVSKVVEVQEEEGW
jgi:hypothetical protein